MKMAVLAVLALAISFAGCSIPNIPIDFRDRPPPEYHAHADLKVTINGETFDFNRAQYMSYPGHDLSPFVHMHDYNPKVVHFHSETATLGDFFASVGMAIDGRCLDTGSGEFCSDGRRNLLVYVNTIPLLLDYNTYVPQDLDRILVYYGEGPPTQQTLNSVTREACIYSQKCLPPLGFRLPYESCSGTGPCRAQ